MAAKHVKHETLTHAEQVERGERARDAASYLARAAEQVAHEDVALPFDENPFAASAADHAIDRDVSHVAAQSSTSLPAGTATSAPSGIPVSAPAGTTAGAPTNMNASHAAVPQAASAAELSRENAANHYLGRARSRATGTLLKRVLAGALAVVAALAIASVAFVSCINGRLSAGVGADLLAVLTGHSGSSPYYMLLLGVDKSAERESSGDFANYRADTIILARIAPRDKLATLVSIPRDTQVSLGEHGQQKINAAYSLGGPAYLVEVVSELAGVPIAHYAEVDFDGFASVVDQVGGIDVSLPVAVVDPEYTGLNLAAGEHHLDGYSALMLVRTRHAYDAYGGGDFYRAANQRTVIGAIARKVLAVGALSLPGTVSTLANYVTTDMDVGTLVALASQFAGFDVAENLYTGQAPTTSEYVGDTWYELLDTAAWKDMMARVDAGEPPYADATDDFTAGVAAGMAQVDANSDGVGVGVEPDYSGTVAVLNAAGVSGLAGEAAGRLAERGFDATAANTGAHDVSAVVYNGDDALAKAIAATDVLGLAVEPTANDGTYPTDANVVVVLGADAA